MSTPDLHRRKYEIFLAACDVPPAERQALLRNLCEGDRLLCEQVEALLARDGETAASLDQPLVRPDAFGSHLPRAGERAGEFIGPYRLVAKIGEGGFGTVWLAERFQPMVQRVALKVIKPGMDSNAVLARFEQERQALAVMDHPNVARVFDGGVTPAGRPYFVMEYVKGESITTFADRRRLTLTQRLQLFIPVCEAVQHAHMKAIIHRDVKPSNVLVTTVDDDHHRGGASRHGGLVKVIDFGVAKAIGHSLTDRTILTETGQMIGTPEYMSPEQTGTGALDIDTRSDVYSLGVVLYELLVGALPFDSTRFRDAGYAEIQRMIREVEAPRPSTRLSTIDPDSGARIAHARQAGRDHIASELRRELEWIPLKALRKDRSRRYASAEMLAADIRRYLEGKPLVAGPDSRLYLARKFVSRNRLQVAAGAAVLIALLLGLAGTLWQAREARAQRDASERSAAVMRITNDFTVDALLPAIARFPGAAELVIPEVLEAAAWALDQPIRVEEEDPAYRYRDEPLVMAALRSNLAETCLEYGWAELGKQQMQIVVALCERESGPDDPRTIEAMVNLGRALWECGENRDAEALLSTATARQERVTGRSEAVASSLQTLGVAQRRAGRLDDAERSLRKSLAIWNQLRKPRHWRADLCRNSLALVLRDRGDLAEAERMLREAYALARGDPREPPRHWDSGMIRSNHGDVLRRMGRFAEAEQTLTDAQSILDLTLFDSHEHSIDLAESFVLLYSEWAGHEQDAARWREEWDRRKAIRARSHRPVNE